jgi:hypothetical protein
MRKVESDTVDQKAIFESSGLHNAIAGAVSFIDLRLPESAFIDGGELIAWGSEPGDYVKCQVIDRDGLIPEPYGPMIYEHYPIISEWVRSWGVCGNGIPQKIMVDYKGEIPPGFYLRTVYASLGTSEVKVVVNYRIHRKV